MFSLKTIKNFLGLVPRLATPQFIQCAGLKNFPPPKVYGDIEYSERPKLRMMLKVPQYPSHVRAPKMQKRLILMRGPETIHNKLIHKQYGIIATQGGRLKYPHVEMARLSIGKKLDTSRMFAIWRVADLWQPLHKRGIGVRMGKGKGSIDHYCTPVRAGRVILEVGGHCEFEEVKKVLTHVADNLPFKAMAVSHEMLENIEANKEKNKRRNLNIYTKQYIIQNNLSGCHTWMSPYDHKWFGEYL